MFLSVNEVAFLLGYFIALATQKVIELRLVLICLILLFGVIVETELSDLNFVGLEHLNVLLLLVKFGESGRLCD